MKTFHASKLSSILLSTACLVAFLMLAGPVTRPESGVSGEVDIREALNPAVHSASLRVPAGKSLIVDNPGRIVRASIGRPELAGAVSIDDHQLLVNGKTPGETNVTLWEADGSHKQLQLHVESASASSTVKNSAVPQQVAYHGLVASYENAMDRVETAITGVAR
jgi:Flp pilus assembly secretin CpaC